MCRYAAWADKYGGNVQETPLCVRERRQHPPLLPATPVVVSADMTCVVCSMTRSYGVTMSIHEPVGVIGMVCPKKQPLLGFISLVAPAVVRGNTVVVVRRQCWG